MGLLCLYVCMYVCVDSIGSMGSIIMYACIREATRRRNVRRRRRRRGRRETAIRARRRVHIHGGEPVKHESLGTALTCFK